MKVLLKMGWEAQTHVGCIVDEQGRCFVSEFLECRISVLSFVRRGDAKLLPEFEDAQLPRLILAKLSWRQLIQMAESVDLFAEQAIHHANLELLYIKERRLLESYTWDIHG
jgi:hypothetical protein